MKNQMKAQKENLTFNVCYYIGKHLAFMILCLYLTHAYVTNALFQLAIVLFLDWFVQKYAIIDSLESDNGFVIKKSELDAPFVLFTSIGLIILSIIFKYEWWIILVLTIFNIICFCKMDANNENRIAKANEAMKEYLKNHKTKQIETKEEPAKEEVKKPKKVKRKIKG